MQLYITAKPISYCNYPISKMCWPIMSVIFGKVLYLIPIKMPPKIHGKFHGHYTYIRLSDYQMAIAPYPYYLTLKKERRRKIKPLTAFYCDLESYLFVQYFITIA